MRLAIISDIHGNLTALEAALADIRAESPDQTLFLGDIADRGPQPHDVIQCVQSLNCPAVMGNTDDLLVAPPSATELNKQVEVPFWGMMQWCRAQLSDDDLVFMRTFQPTLTIPLENGQTLLCYHGSPRSNMDRIWANTPDDDLQAMLGQQIAPIMIGGHTHLPLFRRLHDQIILNPGSIGLAFTPTPDGRELNNNRAEYLLLTVERGRLSVEFRQVVYSLDHYIQMVQKSGMPYQDWWLPLWQEV
ncbi:MAG: metallophosphoesterase family protein [Anaerolineae bacterium]|nr:MAG: metallophosphoesterase family protein [Anaerolineae bacterium]